VAVLTFILDQTSFLHIKLIEKHLI